MAEGFADPRHTSYITYPQKVMTATALMKNVCGITSMTQMTEQFNEETIIQNIGKICEMPEELKELPHFIVVEHKKNGLRYYNPADGKKKYMSADDLYGYHLDIKPYFEWKKYFSDYEKNRAAIFIDNKAKEILYMPGTKIAEKIRLIKKDAEERLLNKKMKKEALVRLKSYFLTVSRSS